MTEIKVTKTHLDNLVRKFENPEFIKDDPVQFPHEYEGSLDKEISGFLSSVFAFGNRKKIIENLELIHEIINPDPFEFVINFEMDRDAKLLSGFKYRFYQEREVVYLIYSLSQVLKKYGSLENAFMQGYSDEHSNVKEGLIAFVNLFRENLPDSEYRTENYLKTFYQLVPSPDKCSACKRLNLFLKWMVREGPVDLCVWTGVPTSKLVIPLDTHVSQISRQWGLTDRKTDDWRTAVEITENLKLFDADDPVKYDFAIFGTGVAGVI